MASRERDWLDQAKRDLEHAALALSGKHYEWACFAAQQAAEKAVKAVYQRDGEEAWGHSVGDLLEGLRAKHNVGESLLDAGRELDQHYIPSRYPNAHPQQPPYRHYTRRNAEQAIENGESISRFCEDLLAQ